MTTHLRARAAQAGALLALVVGGVAAAPAVALAAPPDVQINNLSPTDVLAGGQIQLQYTVTNHSGGNGGGGGGGNNSANIKVTGMSCNGDCSQVTQIEPNGNKQFNAKLTAPQVAAGSVQTVTVTISVTIGNDQNTAQSQVTVRGPDKPQTVTAITGKVKDSDGKAISGASVGARDSNGSTFSATTNGSGSFSINASGSKPIAPGEITVAAGKNGYVNASVEVTGSAGKTVNVPLTLKLVAASASASPSASSSDVPSAPAAAGLDTNVPSQLAVQPSDGTALKNASQNGSSSSTLFIVLGGLLVAAGIGAIVLVLMRRRNAAGHDDGDDPTAMGGGPGVIPPSQGRFNDATRVASPVAAGPATMIAPRSGAPSIADAPTMIHRPVPAVEDEFPDPYGAVLPPGGGYAGTQAGGWDDQPAAGAYGAPNQYGPAEDDYAAGQYGGGQGGYGGGQYGAAAGAPAAAAGPERFDEHTSLYQPESDQDGYGQNGYGPGGDAGQYGGAGQAGGAYGGGAGGAGQYGGGAYGGAAGGGQYGAGTAAGGGQYGGAAYSGRADEDYRPGGAYPGGGGYGQEPADQGGYGSPAGGIDSGNGYGPQGGAAPGAGQYGGTYGGGAAAGAGGYGGGPQYGGGYDERGVHDQGQPAGGEYGPPANGPAPQQYGGGYDQYDEQNSGGYTGGRRGAAGHDDQHQQPSRRGTPRRPDDY